MHVSRPPKPNTPIHTFIKQLVEVTLNTGVDFFSAPVGLCSTYMFWFLFCRWLLPNFLGWRWNWSTRRSTWWRPQWPGSMSDTACAGSQGSLCLTWRMPNLGSVDLCWTPCGSIITYEITLLLLSNIQLGWGNVPLIVLIFDVSPFRSQVDLRKLKENGLIIAETMARFIFNLSDKVIIYEKTNKQTQTWGL